jgi:hypothetical protein
MLSDVRTTSMRLANLRGAIVFKPEITKTEPVGCARIPAERGDWLVPMHIMYPLEAARELALRSSCELDAARC